MIDHGPDPPVVNQLIPVKQTQNSIGVSHIYDQKHF
jgi:hypothetical protein